MSIFNFDNNNNKKNHRIDPIYTLGVSFYAKERQNQEHCQMCGDSSHGANYLQQLWVEDLPLARICTGCVGMLQRAIIDLRKEKRELKRQIESIK
jgi:hypothetical protein